MPLRLMKACLALVVLAAVMLFGAVTDTLAQRQMTRLGNPATRFTPPVNTAPALQETFKTFAFTIDDGAKIHNFVVPKVCGNLSLVSQTEQPMPECIRITMARSCASKQVTFTAAGTAITNNQTKVVRVLRDGKQVGELLPGSGFKGTFPLQPGRYTFMATDNHGREFGTCERDWLVEACATAQAPPPPPPPPPPPTISLPKEGPAKPTMPAFPWPPPQASAETVIPDNWLPERGTARLGEVANALERALTSAKYRKWSYSSVPRGFALVSQMEQIKSDGTPSPEPARWSTSLPAADSLTILEFIRALAGAQPGYYRVIVYVVTDQPWSRTAELPTAPAAEQWLARGFTRLPADVGAMPYGPEYRTTALVYEFTKASQQDAASLVATSPVSADDHLRRAGVAEPLSRR